MFSFRLDNFSPPLCPLLFSPPPTLPKGTCDIRRTTVGTAGERRRGAETAERRGVKFVARMRLRGEETDSSGGEGVYRARSMMAWAIKRAAYYMRN